MRVLIVGANGQIGRRLVRQMAAGTHQSHAMIRNADQARALQELGADEVVIANLESDVQPALDGCDAVIFTAGSGGHTGPDKTDAVDRDGAIAMIDAACKAGVERFVMVSAMGADEPESGPPKLQHYLRAKQAADTHLRESGLRFTIVRPGGLSNEPATGHIELADALHRSGTVSRDDVAAVLLHVLDAPAAEGRTLELLAGDAPIEQAIAAL